MIPIQNFLKFSLYNTGDVGINTQLQRREVPDFSSFLRQPVHETKDQPFCWRTSTTRALQMNSDSYVLTKHFTNYLISLVSN